MNRSFHYGKTKINIEPTVKQWNVVFPTKRERLLNELRKFHYATITPQMDYYKLLKVTDTIDRLNKKLRN